MINVELSNIWSCVSLPDLLGREKTLFDAHLRLRANTPGEQPFLGWLGQSDALTARMLHAVRKAAEQIRASGSVCVVVGSGGAWLAAQAALQLLRACCPGAGDGQTRLIFAGSDLSSQAWLSLCDRLDGKDLCLHIISPHGDELEPAIASRAIRWMLERRYGADSKRRIFLSALADSPLAAMAQDGGYTLLPLPAERGGDYSALTSAVLLPLAVAGFDPLEFLEGAAGAWREYDLRAFENPVWLYAGARHTLEARGRQCEALCAFDPAFSGFLRWWKQLLLRRTCRDGAGLLPFSMELPGEQDALDAALGTGKRPVFETMLRVSAPAPRRVGVEMDWKDYDGLDYLSGRTLEDVERAGFEALCAAQAERDVPIAVLELEQVDAYHLGELFYFFELSAALCALADGVDPFAPMTFPAREDAARQLGRA